MSEVVSVDLLKALVIYSPETGLFVWRKRTPNMFASGRHSAEHACARWNTRYAGQPAFATQHSQGYLMGRIGKVGVLAHRAAWAIVHGSWPSDEIDHINHDRKDNRIANLRNSTRSTNARNGRSHRDSASTYLGVSLNGRDGVWVAQIGLHGENTYLGRFSTEIEAALAYDKAARRHFGTFANLNFPDTTEPSQ